LGLTNRRVSPLFTPVSIAATVVFLIGFGVVTWVQGGLGFSPGPVSAKSQPGVEIGGYRSHADFEGNCNLCHLATETNQANLCMQCHQDIATQVQTGVGLHGRFDPSEQCASCHGEHKGHDFDPTGDALRTFNHSRTHFSLDGKHGQLECAKCHEQGVFTTATPACASCHKEPAMHAGLFSTDCQTCHNTFTWNNVTLTGKPFKHNLARFVLTLHSKDFNDQPMTCKGCHTQDPSNPNQPKDMSTCILCHGAHDKPFMAKHIEQYGPACLACHDGKDRLHGFSHEVNFPLTGKHASLTCVECHKDGQFRNTPATCAGCHKESTLHTGVFGQRCDYCHSTRAWQPAPLQSHTFPLAHGAKQESDCKTCHTSGGYQQYTCYTCHDHTSQGIASSHAKLDLTPEKLTACADCHKNGKINQ
jgi:hypothetical protein